MDRISDRAESVGIPNRIKTIYVCTAVLLISVFIALLYRPIQAAFHEHDLLFMMPVMSSIPAGQSFFESIKVFLYNPYTMVFGDPWMNTYLSVVLAVFGFQTKYYIFTSIALHFLCALFLYLVLRMIDFDFRVAFFSSLVYLTLFIHFGYYFFPMATHHVFVIFFSLLIMYLYFSTMKKIDEDRNWRYLFWLTISANFLASFCQITILILPIGILSHILISSNDVADRLKKYDIWIPLFITYLGYPLLRTAYTTFPHLKVFLHRQGDAPGGHSLYLLLFLSGIGLLSVLRYILKLSCKYHFGRILKILCVSAIVSYIVAFIIVLGRNDLITPSKVKLFDWLSPLNIFRPMAVMLEDFIFPIKAAFSTDSTVIFNVMSRHSGAIALSSAVFMCVIFMKKFFFRHKGLIVIMMFYIIALRYMRIETSVIRSRYFIYVTPLFCIVFCSSFMYMYDLIIKKTRLKTIFQEFILALIFIGLCIPNIFAIKTELYRSKFVNNFLSYDDIRAAYIINNDINTSGSIRLISPENIFIEGVQPMPFIFNELYTLELEDHLKYDPFRYVLAQTLDNRSVLHVSVNMGKPGDMKGKLLFNISGPRIYDSKGLNIDRFSSCFDDAMRELRLGDYKKAYVLFRKAIGMRPFLLNYILSKNDLKELKCITGERDLKSWVKVIVNYYETTGGNEKKAMSNSALINDEIDEYIRCIVYAAYLSYIAGEREEGNRLLEQIRYIENDQNKVLALLNNESSIQSEHILQAFSSNSP